MKSVWTLPSEWPVEEVAVVVSDRRSMTLRFDAMRGLELRMPRTMKEAEALAFVLSKKQWVTRQIQRAAAHAAQFPPPAPGEIWWRGEPLRLVHEPGIRQVERGEGVCRVDFHRAEAQLRAGLRADLVRRIEACIAEAVPEGPRPLGIQIRRMKSRWGSCSRDGRMRFNEALGHLDDRCVRYVVCHELAHLVHFNHSAAFYAYLGQILPTHREDERHVHAHQHLLVHGGYALPDTNKKAGTGRLS